MSVTGHDVSKGCLEAKRWFHSQLTGNASIKQQNKSIKLASISDIIHKELDFSSIPSMANFQGVVSWPDWFDIYTQNEPVLQVRFAKMKLDCVDS